MVRETVLKCLREDFKVETYKITDESTLDEDLGFDGFKVYGLLMKLYEYVKFKINMDLPENKNALKTFGELVAAIERSLI